MDLSERARQFGIFKDHRLEVAANSPWLFPILLTLTTLALFADCIGPDIVFAYRDAVHFYPPLYELVRDEWLAGRIPLWNPLLNCGQPLAGMATAGVFYPPQLLLSLLLPSPMAASVQLQCSTAPWDQRSRPYHKFAPCFLFAVLYSHEVATRCLEGGNRLR